jgi:hypothetical protein
MQFAFTHRIGKHLQFRVYRYMWFCCVVHVLGFWWEIILWEKRSRRTWEKSWVITEQISVKADVSHQSCTHRYHATDTWTQGLASPILSYASHRPALRNLPYTITTYASNTCVHITAVRMTSHLTSTSRRLLLISDWCILFPSAV